MEVAPEGTLQLQWRYQSDEWVDPSDVEMEGTDLVAIADPGAGRVYTIASQGDQVRGWGRLGDGPGEWQGVSGMVLHAGEVLVQPTSAPYVERFDAGGERMGRLEVGEPVTLVGSSDSLLIASSRSGPGRVIMIDPRQGTILNEVRTAPIERYPLDRYGSCWRLAAAQDRVYRLNCSAGRIEVLDPSGSRTALFEMADEPRASTEEELDAYIERFWESQSDGRPLDPIIRRQLDHVREGAAIFPKYTAIRADPRSGRMILVEQPFGDHGSDDATLHIVSPDGHHMSRIHTQSRIRDLAFVGDTIAMLVRDPATGLAELQLHLLQLEPR
ncbi:MAG: hypothetical protein EA351_13665 [Gemmatimonadales bacterium]|nr:MAG: hypothetical protein EA351_13665 [Gemmatimonadales bacterium]